MALNHRTAVVQKRVVWYNTCMNEKGFSLIELLVTVAVIGILAAAAATAYIGTTKKAARSEAYSNLESLSLLEENFFAENSVYTGDLGVTTSAACDTAAEATANVEDTTDGIQTELPKFRPGNATNFCYYVLANEDITGTGQTPCFHAVAVGIKDTRVSGDVFDIDCNNDRTF
jgi:prepilin-type N-terminal cleavage/methylation domain-containing protein